MFQRFTTKASTRLERSRQWRAFTKAQQVEFGDDHEASISGGDFGAVRLCVASLGQHRVMLCARGANAAAGPALEFLFQEEGCATIDQCGRASTIQPGQWCAVRRDMPFVIDAPGRSRQLAITVPCGLVPAPRPRRGVDWWRQPRSFLRGPAQILHASASATVMTGHNLSAADCSQIGGQIALLVDMTVRASDRGPLPDVQEGRRRAILEFIDRNLADVELGVTTIARAFNLSPRSIHKLFEGETRTVARTIWERRLECCRDLMVDPSLAARSITEIAHRWGFNDSQHFSRVFKQRFGMTPRDYRRIFALH